LRTVAIALLIAWLTAAARAQQPVPSSPARQVIAAGELRAAGVRRLGDILPLLDDWSITTVEGFTWRASPRGLNTFEDQGWIVMADDQRLHVELLDARSLDRLPVTLPQIDSVEIISAPASAFGQIAPRGLIRFHLRRPAAGLSVHGLAETANETGDPGPFRFTPLGAPNIDRIGSGVLGGIAYSAPAGFVEVTGGWREHFVTDPPIRPRTFAISTEDYPIIVESTAALRAGYNFGAAGRHRVSLGRTWTRDYFFLPPFGREVPVQSPYTHIGIDGEFRLPGRTNLRYRSAYESNQLDKHPNALDLDFDWRLERWSAALQARRLVSGFEVRVGARIDHATAKTRFSLTEEQLDVLELYGTAALVANRSLSQQAAVSLVRGGGKVGGSIVLSQLWRAGPIHTLTASVGYSELLPAEDEPIWLWQRRGYGFLEVNGIAVTREGESSTASLLSGDARWQIDPGKGLRFAIDAYLRAHSDLTLDDRDLAFDPSDATFAGPVRVVSGIGGEIVGAAADVRWRAPVSGLELRWRYAYQDAVGGDRLFRDTWRAVPRHRARATADYTPVPGLALRADLHYRGATRWTDYADAAALSDGRYDGRVDDALILDVAAQKWLWQRRLRLHLQARNIFDQPVPHHPIGVALGLTFQAQLEMRLGASPKDGTHRPRGD